MYGRRFKYVRRGDISYGATYKVVSECNDYVHLVDADTGRLCNTSYPKKNFRLYYLTHWEEVHPLGLVKKRLRFNRIWWYGRRA